MPPQVSKAFPSLQRSLNGGARRAGARQSAVRTFDLPDVGRGKKGILPVPDVGAYLRIPLVSPVHPLQGFLLSFDCQHHQAVQCPGDLPPGTPFRKSHRIEAQAFQNPLEGPGPARTR